MGMELKGGWQHISMNIKTIMKSNGHKVSVIGTAKGPINSFLKM